MTQAIAKPDLLLTGPLGTSMVNAASSAWHDKTTLEDKITAAIAYAVSIGAKYCYVPDSFLPYNASLVTFNTAVLMLAEGFSNPTEVNVKAYGAFGDGATDDSAAFLAALAYANANVSYYGTTLIATPPVVVPTLRSPSGQTNSYLITQTLALPSGLRMRGTGSFGAVLQFKPSGNSSTLFTFYGAVEAQLANILLENLFCYQNGTVQTSIGIRMRNASFIQLRNCIFSAFRVGAWFDWGQDFDCYDCTFSLCTRGVQIGGNLSQTETPTPPAGVRGGPGTAWFDNGCFLFCKWSQNVLDVNHMGSIQSHGVTTFLNCTFFESATSPVTGKTNFCFFTRTKGIIIEDSWFEEGTATRTLVQFDSVDYDGNAGGVNAGWRVANNHFLMTHATGIVGVLVKRATGGMIFGNVFEFNTGGTTTAVSLQDSSNTTYVGPNSWMSFPDVEFTNTLPNAAFAIGAAPPGGHNVVGPMAMAALPTYGPTIAIQAAGAPFHSIVATNGTAFTISAPVMVRAGFLTVEIFNNSGGALGALTWTGGAGGYILTGGAWTQPANTLRRMITFFYSQPKNAWVEVARTAADY
jgi:hypothetical protein